MGWHLGLYFSLGNFYDNLFKIVKKILETAVDQETFSFCAHLFLKNTTWTTCIQRFNSLYLSQLI